MMTMIMIMTAVWVCQRIYVGVLISPLRTTIVVPWMPEVRAGSDREKWGDIRNENCYVQSCLCNRWWRERVWFECKVLPDYSIIFIVIIVSVEKECKKCWWMVKYQQATDYTRSDYSAVRVAMKSDSKWSSEQRRLLTTRPTTWQELNESVYFNPECWRSAGVIL